MSHEEPGDGTTTINEFDTESSASVQHYIDTGSYLRKGEAAERSTTE